MDESLSTRTSSLGGKRLVVVVFLCLVTYALLLRIFSLDAKVNVDAIWMWHGHTLKFWRGLASHHWMDTFQHHPGVTFMWLAGASMKLLGVFGKPLSDGVLVAGKLPVVLVASLAVGFSFLCLRRILGSDSTLWAALAAFALASEPFAVGHSRTFHLDMLVTAFGWCGALAGIIAARERSLRWSIGAGVLLGLAVLSKVSGGAIAVGVALVFVVEVVLSEAWPMRKRLLFGLGLVVVVSLATVILLWPALLFSPIKTISLFLVRVKAEFAAGHQLFAWGKTYARDPGMAFYLAVLLFRTTPEVMLLGLLALAALVKVNVRSDELRLGVAAPNPLAMILLTHGVWLLIFLSNQKKQDRYFLTLLPLFTLLAVLFAKRIVEAIRRLPRVQRLGKRKLLVAGVVLIALVGLGRTARVVAAYPVPLAWTASIPFLSAERSIQLGIGEGLREVALFIAKDVPKGQTPTVSLYVYHKALAPWIRYRPVHHRQSMYIIDYICLRQRKTEAKLIAKYTKGVKPLLVVRYGGLVYARVYPGPMHRSRLGTPASVRR